MANKGEGKSQKRLSAPRIRKMHYKEHTWTQKSRPGPYPGNESVTLAFVLRDLLSLARNMREVKVALNAGTVRVNGVRRKRPSFSVGIFDVVSIEGHKTSYRLTLDTKGHMVAEQEKTATHPTKLCKVVGASLLKGGKRVLATNDGRSLPSPKNKVAVGDSVELKFPGQEITAHFPLEKGSNVFITRGRHVGQSAKVMELRPGTLSVPALVTLKNEAAAFTTTRKNVFVTAAKAGTSTGGGGK